MRHLFEPRVLETRLWRAAGFVLAGAALVALGACASLPPAPPPRQAKPAEAYAADKTFAAPTADWPSDHWWTAYGDAQLDALIDEGLKGSPTLAEAQARVLKARAASAAASARLLPSISGQGSVNYEKQSYDYLFPAQFLPQGYQGYGQATLNLNWELDFWGKNRAAIAEAVSQARASAADAAEARLVLTTDIATTYADLAALYADRDVASRALQVREETASLVSQRVENGLDTQAELQQARSEPPAARAELAALDEEIALTRDQLAALLGEGPDRGLAIARPATPHLAAFGLPANLKIDLIGRRPDVVAARWRAQAAVKGVTEAKAEFLPDVQIIAFQGQQSLYVHKLFAPGADFGGVGPAVTLPIFEGGALRAHLRGAEADREAAVAAYDGAVTEALHQAADAAVSERALGERLDQSRLALDRLEKAYAVARERYQGGLSTYQAVLLAEDAVLTQRRVVADLESRQFMLDIALVRALGGGFRTGSPSTPPQS